MRAVLVLGLLLLAALLRAEPDAQLRTAQEELKLATPASSDARISVASRPLQQNRQGYSRANGYRR